MAEGPQVLRRTEWLNRHLSGRKILRCVSQREDISAQKLSGVDIEAVFCKGKNIFIALEEGHFLYNHLLMRGKWKMLMGAQLFLPADTWLALDVGEYTVCNIGGQRLRLICQEEVDRLLATLGPDVMATPYPADAIRERLLICNMPVCEALLQQSVLAGVGNIAKSEILFMAGIAPDRLVMELSDAEVCGLIDAIRTIVWDSYQHGGRWECRVYRRSGKPCIRCGTSIVSMAIRPSERATYYCPQCQSG